VIVPKASFAYAEFQASIIPSSCYAQEGTDSGLLTSVLAPIGLVDEVDDCWTDRSLLMWDLLTLVQMSSTPKSNGPLRMKMAPHLLQAILS
jgi:hypothetical protein